MSAMTMRFIVAVLASAVACLAAEALLHATTSRPKIVSEWSLGKPRWSDRELIFSPPTFRRPRHYIVDRERQTIVTLGDSFTKGYPVAQKVNYPSLLRERLAADGNPTNVVDVGMGDTGTDQQLRLFERDVIPRVDPDIVVWQLYPNDEWDNLIKPIYEIRNDALVQRDVTNDWFYVRGQLYRRVPLRSWLTESSYLFRHLLKMAERWQGSAVQEAFAEKPWLWGFEKVRLALVRMKSLAQAHDFRLYFVLVAPQALYFSRETRSPESDRFMRGYDRLFELSSSEPTFIDARFHEFDDRGPAEEIFVDGSRDLSAPGGRHFNEAGYRRLADLVYARLRSDGFVRTAPASPP